MSEAVFYLTAASLWAYAIVTDAMANRLVWVVVDLFAFPIAVVRGIYLLVI